MVIQSAQNTCQQKKKDHYVVFVPLFEKGGKITLWSTFAEVTGTDVKNDVKAYVFIEAGLDNKITLIE